MAVVWVVEQYEPFPATQPGMWDAVGNGESYLFRRDGAERVEELNERGPGRYRLACYERREPA